METPSILYYNTTVTIEMRERLNKHKYSKASLLCYWFEVEEKS